MVITSRQVGQALVLALFGMPRTNDPAELTRALLAAGAGSTASTLVVLDVREPGLLTVHMARAVVAFARSSAVRGTDCVLLIDPHSTAAAVMDVVDPETSVPRYATLGMALAENSDRRRNTVVFDSTDLGRTEEFMSTSYAPMRIASTTGRAGTHITRVAAGTVSVDQLDLAFDMSYDVHPLGKICLCDIDSGTIEDHRVAGWPEPEAFGPGDLFSLSPPDRPYSGRIRRARYTITMFAPDLLGRVAGADRPVRLLHHRPLDANAARHVRAAITHLRDEVLGDPVVSDNALVVSTASQYLAAAVLRAFPNTAQTDRIFDAHDAHPRALRRAIAFIEANAHRDIGADDIARAAYVSVRAVQLAFRRHLDTTPMAYLRQVRLDLARAELLAATPEQTTVTRVAARWGYSRPSVFAAHYRAAYGQNPFQTLRAT